ncbi:MAG: hypothetical protein V1696_02245 [Candidatus Jorgensenbacteria bacterium]
MRKVLIVERIDAYRSIYEKQFAEAGFEVLFANTAEEGIRLFRENSDIVVASVGSRIPGNLELVKEMRAARPTLPIIATSLIPELRAELKQAGCNEEVSDKTSLLSAVAEIIRDQP